MKKHWPISIPVAMAVILLIAWHTLPAQLPSHFDAQGVATSTMRRTILWLYPLIAAIPYLLSLIPKLKRLTPLSAACFSLVVLCSQMVTLTYGRQPVFMYLEPVLLLAAVILLFVRKKS